MALNKLKGREIHVALLLKIGRSNKDIGSTLHMADRTVKHYITSIMTKLNVDNRTQAALKLNGVVLP